jgi:RimJ/RimL family protein N-acetyltransferase
MLMIQTAGVYLLAPAHAAAIQRLASDPAIAAATRMPHPYPENGARDFIERQAAERARGSAYGFAIVDLGEVVGVCGLEGIAKGGEGELGYWVGRPFWGRGYATLAVRMVLEFAFQNLRLQQVNASVLETNATSRRVLEKNGFELLRLGRHDDPLLKRPDELLAVYSITRQRWDDLRSGGALAALHPSLRAILKAELTAGNEVVEISRGWPDTDSVFVRLRHPFRMRPAALPAGVDYAEPDDPHWWRADYSSRAPRHLLAY